MIDQRVPSLERDVNAVVISGMEVGPASLTLPRLAVDENRGVGDLVGRKDPPDDRPSLRNGAGSKGCRQGMVLPSGQHPVERVHPGGHADGPH